MFRRGHIFAWQTCRTGNARYGVEAEPSYCYPAKSTRFIFIMWWFWLLAGPGMLWKFSGVVITSEMVHIHCHIAPRQRDGHVNFNDTWYSELSVETAPVGCKDARMEDLIVYLTMSVCCQMISNSRKYQSLSIINCRERSIRYPELSDVAWSCTKLITLCVNIESKALARIWEWSGKKQTTLHSTNIAPRHSKQRHIKSNTQIVLPLWAYAPLAQWYVGSFTILWNFCGVLAQFHEHEF